MAKKDTESVEVEEAIEPAPLTRDDILLAVIEGIYAANDVRADDSADVAAKVEANVAAICNRLNIA